MKHSKKIKLCAYSVDGWCAGIMTAAPSRQSSPRKCCFSFTEKLPTQLLAPRSQGTPSIHGSPWVSMNTNGYPWISTEIHEYIHGYPWISVDIHGYPWIYMDSHPFLAQVWNEFPWISMDIHDIHGHPFMSADTHGYPRVSMTSMDIHP